VRAKTKEVEETLSRLHFEFSWLLKHAHACAYHQLKQRKHTHTHTHTNIYIFAMVPSSPRGGDLLGPRAKVDDANDERDSRKRVDLSLSATTTTDRVDAASTRDNNSSAKRNNDGSSPETRKDSGSASSSGRSDGSDRRRGGGGEDVEEEERKQQQELLLLEEESGRRSKRASIDVGDESTLERYRRIGMQQKQKQQEEEEQEEEEEEGVELVEEEEDEEKQISSAKISERIKALLAQTKDEMNDKRDEDYDEAEDDMYNTCVYGEYERGGERDDEKEEENDAIYETIVKEEENLSELSSKYSEQMREVLKKGKKEKGKAAFLSKKAAGEDDVKAIPASAEEGKKKMKMKKKGFLSGIFSSKSKKALSSATELGEKDK
jgi:hypothetical protein